ncbi:MAG: hypothetical protein KatS3mg110_0205 [Pirellulaceae bacterium]|nr:MAG: hypothetical protein KatS3mg110_0205 [Pirellulaceae bacterium]
MLRSSALYISGYCFGTAALVTWRRNRSRSDSERKCMNPPPGYTHDKSIERTVCLTQAAGVGSTKRDLSGCRWRVNNDTLVALLANCGENLAHALSPRQRKKTYHASRKRGERLG